MNETFRSTPPPTATPCHALPPPATHCHPAAVEGRAERVFTVSTQTILDALNSPVRREILWLVWDRELSAGEIASSFDLSAATVSGHLKALRLAGMVVMRVDGTFRRYRADRAAVTRFRELLDQDDRKWFPGTTPQPVASSRTSAVVVVTTTAPCDRSEAFRCFTDPLLYSRWAGVPVTLANGNFAAEMEWGVRVRGRYEHVVAPSLVVMTWDFEAEAVPVPGAGQRAYLEITEIAAGCHVEIHQLVRSAEEARYMERAWGVMLARFRDGVGLALDPGRETALRPKRRRAIPR